MKNHRVIVLDAELSRSLGELKILVDEVSTYRTDHIKNYGDLQSSDLRVLGSILHDFYTGLEKVFLRISKLIDGNTPEGNSWHMDLLNQMSLDIELIRPPILSSTLKEQLSDYLRFRHVFRNVYGFTLKWQKMAHLIDDLNTIYHSLEKSFGKFQQFLKTISDVEGLQ